MFARVTLCVLMITSGRSPGASDDKHDPIQARLDRARKKYDEDQERFQEAVLESLDKLEDADRDKGDKRAVDQIKLQRDAFTKSGAYPLLMPVTLKQKQAASVKELDAAYANAVKDFTKSNEDEKAAQIEKEWEVFRKDANVDTRAKWEYDNGLFRHKAGKSWEEEHPVGKIAYQFKETERTDKFIILERKNGNGVIRVKLYEEQCWLSSTPKGDDFKLLYKGKWVP